MIISGFAGTGKTYAANKLPSAKDLESSDYQWTFLDKVLI